MARIKMSAGKNNLIIDQGSDFSLTLNIKEDGVNKNLTGWLARGHLRESMDTAQHWAFDFSGTTFDDNGNLIINLAHDVTANNGNSELGAGSYFYDVEIYKTSTDEVKRIIQGKATVTRQVTR
jgi:hypothetical protein